MTPIQALLGFAAWTLLLIAGVFLYRGMRFLTGTPINHWPRGNKPADDAPFVKRLEDAHANCLENLPVFAVIVLAAAALGRLGDTQSLAHLSGTGPVNVFVRASFWSVQLALFGWMLVKLLA